jgi:NADPH2:quinone reductase
VYELTPEDRTACLDGLTQMLKHKELTHTIAAEYGLAQVVQAHEAVESGKLIGNVVINTTH